MAVTAERQDAFELRAHARKKKSHYQLNALIDQRLRMPLKLESLETGKSISQIIEALVEEHLVAEGRLDEHGEHAYATGRKA